MMDLVINQRDKKMSRWILLFCVLLLCSGCGSTLYSAKLVRAQNVLKDFAKDLEYSYGSSATSEGVDLTELAQWYNAKSVDTGVTVFVSKKKVVAWSENDVRVLAYSYVSRKDGDQEGRYVCLYSNGQISSESASSFLVFQW